MCLQPILEGSGIYVKKINKFVKPKNDGFNVVNAGNTKGQGSDDGKFIGTNVLNEAFLKDFQLRLNRNYPTVRLKKKSWSILLLSQVKKIKTFVRSW